LFFARTTVPLSQSPLTPAELRDALRPIREALQELNHQILWDERYGDVSMLVKRAELMVIAARDATHRTELPTSINTENS
jgi:hypothetical protein